MTLTRPYSLTEDEFHNLQRAQNAIALMSILFDEVQRSTTYTPQMIASFLDGISEDISLVIQAAATAFSTPRLHKVT